jgi:hypothetical protein
LNERRAALNRYYKSGLIGAIGLFVFAIGFASTPFNDRRPSPLSSLLTALFGGPSLVNSDEQILMGYRAFEADIRNSRLSFYGSALTFLDDDDPTTYSAYNFSFDSVGFVKLPDTNFVENFHASYGVDFPTVSGVDIESCIAIRTDTTATSDGISLIFPTLCRIQSTSGQSNGMIGVIFPEDNKKPLEDGDATCRSEIAYWRTLPGFTDVTVVLCAIVDLPYVANAYSATFWMDIIFYQQYGNELYNMRADSRNFRRIN